MSYAFTVELLLLKVQKLLSYESALSHGSLSTEQVDMETARNKELSFFKANPRYADLRNVGMRFLSDKLSTQLIGAIRRQLPAIQNQINTGVTCISHNCVPTTDCMSHVC